ncbi:hypothetical protein MMC25_007424 [Agyrium rufum]|nr:hypothetical protein [Agyrium rufum]
MVSTERPSERSSAAWTQDDDDRLHEARAKSLGWGEVAKLFHSKSPNACRKRYERLKSQKQPGDWEGENLQELARIYVECRQQMWEMLARKMHYDKWEQLEKVCFEKGVPTLKRVANRDFRQSTRSPSENDDSGLILYESRPMGNRGGHYRHPSSMLEPPVSQLPSGTTSGNSSVQAFPVSETSSSDRANSITSFMSQFGGPLPPLSNNRSNSVHTLPPIRDIHDFKPDLHRLSE